MGLGEKKEELGVGWEEADWFGKVEVLVINLLIKHRELTRTDRIIIYKSYHKDPYSCRVTPMSQYDVNPYTSQF